MKIRLSNAICYNENSLNAQITVCKCRLIKLFHFYRMYEKTKEKKYAGKTEKPGNLVLFLLMVLIIF